jgi:hypothetical protein
VRDLDEPVTARLRHRHPGRVLEARHRVDELRPPAVALQAVERLLQQVHPHPVGVHVDLHDLGLVGREHRHGTRVGRSLGDNHVAGVDQGLRDQVEDLLAARRHEHVLVVHAHALRGHDLGDAGLGLVEALGGPVLERLGARLLGDPLRDRRERVRREGARVGEAAGE